MYEKKKIDDENKSNEYEEIEANWYSQSSWQKFHIIREQKATEKEKEMIRNKIKIYFTETNREIQKITIKTKKVKWEIRKTKKTELMDNYYTNDRRLTDSDKAIIAKDCQCEASDIRYY